MGSPNMFGPSILTSDLNCQNPRRPPAHKTIQKIRLPHWACLQCPGHTLNPNLNHPNHLCNNIMTTSTTPANFPYLSRDRRRSFPWTTISFDLNRFDPNHQVVPDTAQTTAFPHQVLPHCRIDPNMGAWTDIRRMITVYPQIPQIQTMKWTMSLISPSTWTDNSRILIVNTSGPTAAPMLQPIRPLANIIIMTMRIRQLQRNIIPLSMVSLSRLKQILSDASGSRSV
jgi:hypothetical protein